jgi:Ca2+-transporting ATPase
MLTRSMVVTVLGQGALLAVVGLVAFWLKYHEESDLEKARSMTFSVIVLAELFRALAARSQSLAFWQLRITTNPYLIAAVAISILLQVGITLIPFTREIFHLSLPTLSDTGLLMLLACAPVTVIESVKFFRFSADVMIEKTK